MKSSFRLGRIAGIEVGIHYSWFVVLLLFWWTLSASLLPGRYPGWPVSTYWMTGIAAALLLFVSVLIHELAHSLVARSRGLPVEGITLFLLGGVSNIGAEARSAKEEFIVAVVGPLTSLLLFVLIWGLDRNLSAEASPVAAVVWYLWWINLALAVFNMLPAYPLDGGRVLRSIAWTATGSMARATKIAARGGQAIGILMIAIAIYYIARGDFRAGIWWGFIGWFLFSTASRSLSQASAQAQIEGIRVRDVMEPAPPAIPPDASVSEAVFTYLLAEEAQVMPVVDGGRLIGVMSLSDARSIPGDRWTDVSVREAMTSTPPWSVRPDDPARAALGLLAEHSVDRAFIVDGGRLVGVLSRANLMRRLHSTEGGG